MSLLEHYRRKAEKWLVDGIHDAEIGDFDFVFHIGDTRYRIKVFSITWIILMLAMSVIGLFAIWAFSAAMIIIGG